MRLLFVSHSFPPPDRPLSNVGGMQRVATELHTSLSAHPDVDLFTLVLRSSWRWTHLRVLPFLARAYWTIDRLLDQRAVDGILFSSMVTASLAIPLRQRLVRQGIRSAAIVHGRDVTLDVLPYQRLLIPRIFESLDAVLPVSRATGAQCLERGLAPEKLHVLPNGIELDRFAPLQDPAIMRQELIDALGDPANPLPDDALLLCSVGRQVRRKGFAWFVENVMPLLPENVHYWLAGDGPESEQIRSVAARKGLTRRVRLLGRVTDDDLQRLYRGSDLFIMPNIPVPGDMEGFGVVLLEAGLCGLPAVSSRLEGILDVVTEGRNGHLIESGDARGFADCILYYDRNRLALRVASVRAAEHVAATFGWPAVADRYVRTMESFLPSLQHAA